MNLSKSGPDSFHQPYIQDSMSMSLNSQGSPGIITIKHSRGSTIALISEITSAIVIRISMTESPSESAKNLKKGTRVLLYLPAISQHSISRILLINMSLIIDTSKLN